MLFRSDFLKDHPHLLPLVRTIAVHPEELAPFPLLRILPNLSQINFEAVSRKRPVTIPPSIQWSLQSHGTRIETLHFIEFDFETLGDFARLLLAFPVLKDLSLHEVQIPGIVESTSASSRMRQSEVLLKRRLTRVKALTVCALVSFPTLG